MVQSDDEQLKAAKVEIRKDILEEYEITGKIVLKDVRHSKGEGDDLLGTVCGSFTDSGSSDDQTPTRFIYMAIDEDTLLEEVLEDVTPELQKAAEEANKLFNELWNDGCK